MSAASYILGNAPVVSIGSCDGDLNIRGHDETRVVITTDTMPESVQEDGQLAIGSCDDDLLVEAPLGARVTVGSVGGDARARRLRSVQMDRVDGDLQLREIAETCAVVEVDGDVEARDIRDLSLRMVDGDVTVNGITGRLALGYVGGDAHVRGMLESSGPVRIGGDLTIEPRFVAGREYELAVDGDVSLTLHGDADLLLRAEVDGDVSGLRGTDISGRFTAAWGAGGARLYLKVGGDLHVSGPRPEIRPPTDHPAGTGGAWRGLSADAAPVATSKEEVAVTSERGQGSNPDLALLEAVARGEVSPEEAEALLNSPGA